MSEECCPNCGVLLHGLYCSGCGQRKPRPDDYSTLGFLVDAATEVFSVDGKTLRTLRHLLFHPGRLTLDHFQGRRARYLKPIQLFVIVNVIFFLIAVSGGVFDFTLEEYLRYGPPSPQLVQRLVNEKITRAGISLQDYTVAFNGRENLLRKGLIFLLVPVLGAALWVLNYRHRPYFVQHIVSSIHFFSFFWLFATATAFPIAALAENSGLRADDVLVPFFQATTLIYLYLMLRTVYAQSWMLTLLKAAICVAVVFQLLEAYRVLLFFGTYLIT